MEIAVSAEFSAAAVIALAVDPAMTAVKPRSAIAPAMAKAPPLVKSARVKTPRVKTARAKPLAAVISPARVVPAAIMNVGMQRARLRRGVRNPGGGTGVENGGVNSAAAAPGAVSIAPTARTGTTKAVRNRLGVRSRIRILHHRPLMTMRIAALKRNQQLRDRSRDAPRPFRPAQARQGAGRAVNAAACSSAYMPLKRVSSSNGLASS